MPSDLPEERTNILLVDDQPAKLMSYELILGELGQNLLKASSAKEALEILLKTEVSVILVDVCMPELDGFELAQMIREHPRFEQTAIIFISAIHLSELDSLKGYEMGAVDYVPVPVAPHVLRAKVRVFVDLYRKTRQLARLNNELEDRVAQRTSELETAIARQELLAKEVDHRARNALAVIQAIVSMTSAAPAADFARAIEGRIQAMARAHTLLSQSRWQGADLDTLVNEELAPYRGDDERLHVEGVGVLIKPAVAQSLALILHELATNAAKYGALSGSRGKLTLSWTLGDQELTLRWSERCVGLLEAPSRSGFGAKVIAATTKSLEGQMDQQWLSTGLVSVLRLPAKHFDLPVDARRPKMALVHEAPRAAPGQPLLGRRYLLVEDEPLVAMMMQQLLSDFGGDVVGPFGTIPDAYAALNQRVDAALLDVNVSGDVIYPLAEELVRAGVPIVFLTGYQAETLQGRFADTPVLTKPIDANELLDILNVLNADQQSQTLAG